MAASIGSTITAITKTIDRIVAIVLVYLDLEEIAVITAPNTAAMVVESNRSKRIRQAKRDKNQRMACEESIYNAIGTITISVKKYSTGTYL